MNNEEQTKVEEIKDDALNNQHSEEKIIYEDDLDEKKSKGSKGYLIWIILIVVAALVVFNWSNFFPQDESSQILATVNGQPILQSEVDLKYDQVPEFYKTLIDKETILNQTINEILLKQEISKSGTVVTKEEVNQAFNELLSRNMMSLEQFEEYLEVNSLDRDVIMGQIEDSLLLSKYLENNLLQNMNISNEELSQYYNDNKELFTTLESRNVSHILICFEGKTQCENQRTKEEATELINEVISKTKTDDFADLAVEYSDGPSSIEGGNLGLVDVNTAFVEEFKVAALDLKEGKISGSVETDFGFHLIKVNEIIPVNTLPFLEVENEIKSTITNQRTTEAIEVLIEELKVNSDIQILTN